MHLTLYFGVSSAVAGQSYDCIPWWQGSWGQHRAHLGPTGPRWAPCWPMNFAIWVSASEVSISDMCKNRPLSIQHETQKHNPAWNMRRMECNVLVGQFVHVWGWVGVQFGRRHFQRRWISIEFLVQFIHDSPTGNNTTLMQMIALNRQQAFI